MTKAVSIGLNHSIYRIPKFGDMRCDNIIRFAPIDVTGTRLKRILVDQRHVDNLEDHVRIELN